MVTFIDKLQAKHSIQLTYTSGELFRSLFNGAFEQIDAFLREQPNFKSVRSDRWFTPFDEDDPTTLTFIYPLYRRADAKKLNGKLGDLIAVEPLKVQTPPVDGATEPENIGWDHVLIGSLLCVRVLSPHCCLQTILV